MTGLPLQPDTNAFVRKVESIILSPLSVDERAALLALPMQIGLFAPNQDIVHEGDRPSCCFAVLEGIVTTYKSTPTGGRQVMAYHVAGDIPDLQSLHLKVIDSSIAAVSPCRVGFVQHDAMRALFRAHPGLVDVFWRLTLIDAAIMREWMLNNGRREAYARMAHLFCELVTRLDAVGLARDRNFILPMTQLELADALSITSVHVNRVLKALKTAELVTLRNRRLIVHDWEGLQAAAEFDPTYLHLRGRDAARDGGA